MWLPVADVERAVVRRDVDGACASDAEAEALYITTLLDVLELIQLVQAGLELLRGATLRGRVPLDLVQSSAELGELPFEVVLLRLQGIGGVDERGVVADGELAALGLGAPLKRDEEAEENGRHEQHERVLDSPFSRSGSLRHAFKCPMSLAATCVETRPGGWGESNSRRPP